MTGDTVSGPRCAALIGPYSSGKTTLLESLLFVTEAINRKGSIDDGNTVGDGGAVARSRGFSVELSVANCNFMGDSWALIDCPGSIEFAQDARNALMAADIAVVVCEPDPAKAQALAPTLKFLDDHDVPHLVFINKMDHPGVSVRDTLAALQGVSQRPLVLRHVPIRSDGGEAITGYVDLISERAYAWKPGEPSALIEMPGDVSGRTEEARQEMLETLADFDDTLLEQLLEDVRPEKAEVYRHLVETMAHDQVVPVMMGAAETVSGVFRLWKALRHDTPDVAATAARRGFDPAGATAVQVFKTGHARSGKLSHARVWAGTVTEGMQLGGERVGSLFSMFGQQQNKLDKAGRGAVVALGRMDDATTGDVLAESVDQVASDWAPPLDPVYAVALSAEKRDDEVKMSAALTRLAEEDPSYRVEHNADTHELVLWGQGEIHLAVAAEQLREKYNVGVTTARPQVPYRETIRKPVEQHARHKKQSGGHGQFADVKIEIRPQARGAGFEFSDRIVGGAVPKQYIPSVETGVKNYLSTGPLGFPVVDVAVCLTDGQFHAVDSSDMAFQTAAAMAMREGMPQCSPVLLEPICHVDIDVPSEHTSKVNTLVTGRRGQLLGFDAKAGWDGWDTVSAQMPQSEMADLIVELRSLTQGTGTFRFRFEHLQELTGRDADTVVSQRESQAA
jgi:elongation factor G